MSLDYFYIAIGLGSVDRYWVLGCENMVYDWFTNGLLHGHIPTSTEPRIAI